MGIYANGSLMSLVKMYSATSPMLGGSRSSENKANISSFPYLNSAKLYFGPGEGGGTHTLVPLDKSRILKEGEHDQSAGLKILLEEPSDKTSDAFEFGSDKMYDNV